MNLYSQFIVFIVIIFLTGCSSEITDSEERREGHLPIYETARLPDMKSKPLLTIKLRGEGPAMVLTEISADKTYGHTPENPVKVGGKNEGKGVANERMYLNALFGPDGQYIIYRRVGNCCAFETPEGLFGIGLLDQYKIMYLRRKDDIYLYINMYDYEDPKAPYGFTLKEK